MRCFRQRETRVTFAGALLQQKRQREQSGLLEQREDSAGWEWDYPDTPCPVSYSLCSTAERLNCLTNSGGPRKKMSPCARKISIV
jgi:hypothetical protein